MREDNLEDNLLISVRPKLSFSSASMAAARSQACSEFRQILDSFSRSRMRAAYPLISDHSILPSSSSSMAAMSPMSQPCPHHGDWPNRLTNRRIIFMPPDDKRYLLDPCSYCDAKNHGVPIMDKCPYHHYGAPMNSLIPFIQLPSGNESRMLPPFRCACDSVLCDDPLNSVYWNSPNIMTTVGFSPPPWDTNSAPPPPLSRRPLPPPPPASWSSQEDLLIMRRPTDIISPHDGVDWRSMRSPFIHRPNHRFRRTDLFSGKPRLPRRFHDECLANHAWTLKVRGCRGKPVRGTCYVDPPPEMLKVAGYDDPQNWEEWEPKNSSDHSYSNSDGDGDVPRPNGLPATAKDAVVGVFTFFGITRLRSCSGTVIGYDHSTGESKILTAATLFADPEGGGPSIVEDINVVVFHDIIGHVEAELCYVDMLLNLALVVIKSKTVLTAVTFPDESDFDPTGLSLLDQSEGAFALFRWAFGKKLAKLPVRMSSLDLDVPDWDFSDFGMLSELKVETGSVMSCMSLDELHLSSVEDLSNRRPFKSCTGGPLVNGEGTFLGIMYCRSTCTAFLPACVVDKCLKHFERFGRVFRPSLGLHLKSEAGDLLVKWVETSAGLAGIKSGDIITSCCGLPTRSGAKLAAVLLDSVLKHERPPNEITVEVETIECINGAKCSKKVNLVLPTKMTRECNSCLTTGTIVYCDHVLVPPLAKCA